MVPKMQPSAQPAGFAAGVWHGLISPLTCLLTVANPGFRIYEANNRGRQYDVGFFIGAVIILGGGGSQTNVPRVAP